MPKINVYLPDDLAEAVKEAGVPVSAVCQRALERAVRRVNALRQAVDGGLEEGVEGESASPVLERFTLRSRAALRLAGERADAEGALRVATAHLLDGVLSEGGNLALEVLRAMEIEPEQVLRDLRALPDSSDPGGDEQGRFSPAAATALELAFTEAVSFGHNYIGCEHLLLGVAAEPNGAAGRVLSGLGAEPKAVRRAVKAALAGYVHLRATTQQQAEQQGSTPGTGGAAAGRDPRALLAAAVQQAIAPLAERIDALERRLDGEQGTA